MFCFRYNIGLSSLFNTLAHQAHIMFTCVCVFCGYEGKKEPSTLITFHWCTFVSCSSHSSTELEVLFLCVLVCAFFYFHYFYPSPPLFFSVSPLYLSPIPYPIFNYWIALPIGIHVYHMHNLHYSPIRCTWAYLYRMCFMSSLDERQQKLLYRHTCSPLYFWCAFKPTSNTKRNKKPQSDK